MAKRKAKTKAPPKKAKPKLDTAFTCPFCNAGTIFGVKSTYECNNKDLCRLGCREKCPL